MSVYNENGTILDQYIKKQVDPNGSILVVTPTCIHDCNMRVKFVF